MAYENNDSEFAIYVNAFVVEGEAFGGVYDSQADALDAARGFIAEMEGLTAEHNGTLDGLDAAALVDRINDQDLVGFAMVAEREVLYT
jgi:hypothetical protein